MENQLLAPLRVSKILAVQVACAQYVQVIAQLYVKSVLLPLEEERLFILIHSTMDIVLQVHWKIMD